MNKWQNKNKFPSWEIFNWLQNTSWLLSEVTAQTGLTVIVLLYVQDFGSGHEASGNGDSASGVSEINAQGMTSHNYW